LPYFSLFFLQVHAAMAESLRSFIPFYPLNFCKDFFMSEHATTRLGSPHQDALAKPKVMRRPAQFSGTAASTHPTDAVPPALLTIRPLTPIMPSAAIPAPLPWQHDGRFAIALLSAVLVFNIAVYYALSHSKASDPARRATTASTRASNAQNVHILDDSKSVALIEP
jgi:hypothetical protein